MRDMCYANFNLGLYGLFPLFVTTVSNNSLIKGVLGCDLQVCFMKIGNSKMQRIYKQKLQISWIMGCYLVFFSIRLLIKSKVYFSPMH
jgi:hypothetical protein